MIQNLQHLKMIQNLVLNLCSVQYTDKLMMLSKEQDYTKTNIMFKLLVISIKIIVQNLRK